MNTSASSSWCIHSWSRGEVAGISNCRRNQISAVLHGVLLNVPGVPLEPNPAADSFQVESSNPDLDQSSCGLLVVKCHLASAWSAAGTIVTILGALGIGAQPAALIVSRRAHFCQTARS